MNQNAVPDVVINKVQSIQRCILRARQEHQRAGHAFATDFTRQDAAVINVIRACEQTIDLASYVIRNRRLGVPTSSAECFSLLAAGGVIDRALSDRLIGMVGFRNVAVHQYEDLNLDIVETVITSGLDDLLAFTDAMLTYLARPLPESGESA